MRQSLLPSLSRKGGLTRRTAKLSMPLLACTLAVSAVSLPPTTAPVVRPPTTPPPQTLMQAIQTATKEVIVGGLSMGFYNIGALSPQPVTLQGTPSTNQGASWLSWYKAVMSGQVQRRDVLIIARAADGHEVQRWTLQGAWPTKVTSATVSPGSSPSLSVSLAYTNLVTSQ